MRRVTGGRCAHPKNFIVHAFMVQQQKFGCPGSADEVYRVRIVAWHGMGGMATAAGDPPPVRLSIRAPTTTTTMVPS